MALLVHANVWLERSNGSFLSRWVNGLPFPLILARGSCRNSDRAIEDSIGEVEDYIRRCVFVAMTCKGVSQAGVVNNLELLVFTLQGWGDHRMTSPNFVLAAVLGAGDRVSTPTGPGGKQIPIRLSSHHTNSPYTSKETNPKTHDHRAIMGDMGSSYALPESHKDVSFTTLGSSEDSLTALPDHAQLFDRDRCRDRWHHGSSIASTWLAQLAHSCYLETRNPTATGINRPHRF